MECDHIYPPLANDAHPIWNVLNSRDAVVRFEMGSGPELDQTGPRVRSSSGSGSEETQFLSGVWFGVHLGLDLLRTRSRPNCTLNLMIRSVRSDCVSSASFIVKTLDRIWMI